MRRRISLILLALATLFCIVAAGGFNTAEADRGLTVTVVDDENAYLGYETSDVVADGLNDTATVTLIELTNRLPHGLTAVETTVEEGDAALSVDATDIGSIEPGETVAITGEVDCSAETTSEVTVSVTASGDAVEVFLDGDTADRRFEIDCQ